MRGFRGYIIMRVLQSILTVLVIATGLFFLFRAAPGDAADYMIDPTFPPEVKEQVRARFGLDRPVSEQYVKYMWNLLQGDMGISFFSQRPVMREIGDRVWNTLILALASFLIAYPLGVFLGAILATKRKTKIDSIGITISLFFRSAPLFWTGMILITIFSIKLDLFPYGRMREIGYEADNLFQTYFSLDFLHHLILPAFVAGLFLAALPMLLMRNSVLETLDEDYIELARAKGLKEREVLFRHGVRNAILPVVTAAAVYIGLALGGMAVIEVVFSWPGLGKLIIDAVTAKDYPLAQGAFIILAIMVSVMNLVADLLYGYLDPRITYTKS